MSKYKHFNFSLFLLLVPVFVNLNVSNGLNFSADPFHFLGAPSLPISYIILLTLAFGNLSRIVFSFNIVLFLILLSIAILETFQGFSRQINTLLGMMVPFLVSYIFTKKNWSPSVIFDQFVSVSYLLVLVKFVADILGGRGLSSNVFILNNFVIYNYYDYFPVFYSLIACLTAHSVIKKQKILLSVIIFGICTFFIFGSESRLAMLLIVILPLNVALSYFLINKYLVFVYCFFLLMLDLLSTIMIPKILDGLNIEASMSVRLEHWRNYWNSFSVPNFFIPTLNEYRQSLNWGTLHNEPLEILSYFGVFGFIYYILIIKSFTNYPPGFRFLSLSILTTCIVGGFFQLNLTNTYLSIVFGIFLFSFSASKNCDNSLFCHSEFNCSNKL